MCNRKFASDRIQQHEVACRKANKQRRTFDSTKQRLGGTEAAAYLSKGKAGGKGRNEPAKPQVNLSLIIINRIFLFLLLNQVPKSNWRQKHEDFIRSIRYAKQATSYEKSGRRRKKGED